MAQGISDSIIVVIKLEADENPVMDLRTKLLETDNSQGEGSNMLIRKLQH
jgi:hypothetical protein